jgi:hypothetical protein
MWYFSNKCVIKEMNVFFGGEGGCCSESKCLLISWSHSECIRCDCQHWQWFFSVFTLESFWFFLQHVNIDRMLVCTLGCQPTRQCSWRIIGLLEVPTSHSVLGFSESNVLYMLDTVLSDLIYKIIFFMCEICRSQKMIVMRCNVWMMWIVQLYILWLS